jgi:hypothetical protein
MPEALREACSDHNGGLIIDFAISRPDECAKVRADVREEIDKLEAFKALTDGLLPATESLGLVRKLVKDDDNGLFLYDYEFDKSEGLYMGGMIGVNTNKLGTAKNDILDMVLSGMPEHYYALFHELIHRAQHVSSVIADQKISRVINDFGIQKYTALGLVNILALVEQYALDNRHLPQVVTVLLIVATTIMSCFVYANKTRSKERVRMTRAQRLFLWEIHAHFASSSVFIPEDMSYDHLDPATLSRLFETKYPVMFPAIMEELNIDEDGFKAMVKATLEQVALLRIAGLAHRRIADIIAVTFPENFSIEGISTFKYALDQVKDRPAISGISGEEALALVKEQRLALRTQVREALAKTIIKGRKKKLVVA